MEHRQRKEVLYLKNRLVREEEQRMLANQRNLSDARKEKLSRNATLIKVLPTPPPFLPNRCTQCGLLLLCLTPQCMYSLRRQSVMALHLRGGSVAGMDVKQLETLRYKQQRGKAHQGSALYMLIFLGTVLCWICASLLVAALCCATGCLEYFFARLWLFWLVTLTPPANGVDVKMAHEK